MPISGYFDIPFGVDGDLTPVPEAVQPSGAISYTQGWGPFYSQDPTVDPSTALLISRAQTNQMFYDITVAIQNRQQHCIPDFIDSTMNGGTPFSYSQYDMVMLGGVAYQSLVNTNTDTPPTANWAVFPLGSTAFSTGDLKPTYKPAPDAGFIFLTDGSIGSASSGASYANANAAALYALWWNNIIDTYCPVTGGRGANAAADFAANKKMGMPKMLGRALGIAGAGSGLTSRALGQALGDENLQSHTHSITDPTHKHNSSVGYSDKGGSGNGYCYSDSLGGATILGFANPGGGTQTASTGITVNTAGTGGAGNMQPTSFINIMVCL